MGVKLGVRAGAGLPLCPDVEGIITGASIMDDAVMDDAVSMSMGGAVPCTAAPAGLQPLAKRSRNQRIRQTWKDL
jgi:hypothetical protein